MNRAGGGQDTLFTILLEHGFFLPVFQNFQLGWDELQFFFDLGNKGFTGADLLFVAEGQFDALAQQCIRESTLATFTGGRRCLFLCNIVWQLIAQGINLNFQLGFVKQMNLVCGLLTAGAELLNPFPAQQFFENLDGVIALFDLLIALLDFSALGGQFLLKTFDNRL
jgi:hypothetical protein